MRKAIILLLVLFLTFFPIAVQAQEITEAEGLLAQIPENSTYPDYSVFYRLESNGSICQVIECGISDERMNVFNQNFFQMTQQMKMLEEKVDSQQKKPLKYLSIINLILIIIILIMILRKKPLYNLPAFRKVQEGNDAIKY